MVGERREPIWQAILPFLTCGIWMHVWLFQTTTELKNHMGREDLNPGLDLLLGFLTCGIYYWYVIYRNTYILMNANQRAGIVGEDRVVLYLLLMIFFYPVTLYLFQEELNRLWARYTGSTVPASTI